MSTTIESDFVPGFGIDKKQDTHVALREISKEPAKIRHGISPPSIPGTDDDDVRPQTAQTWLHSDSEESDLNNPTPQGTRRAAQRPEPTVSTVDWDTEAGPVRTYSVPRTQERW